MSLIKDVIEDGKSYVFRARITHILSPSVWMRHHKWRKQRADRGWSDYDTWGAGEHIAKMTADMLQHLLENGHCSWPDWFELNVQEKGKDAYKNLESVIEDINNYLKYIETSWADGLYCDSGYLKRDDGGTYLAKQMWYDERTNKLQTEAAISRRINKWSKEDKRLYENAQKAMTFFGRHFAGFWD